MRVTLLFIACGAAFLLGCGSDGGHPSQTSAAASSGSGGTTSTGVGGGAGAGGSDGGADAGGGGAAPCSDPTVFFEIDGDGDALRLGAECHPQGYLSHGGVPLLDGGTPPTSDTLYLAACPTLTADTRIWIYAGSAAWPATSDHATVHYQKSGVNLDETPASGGTLDVTGLGDVGGVIEGSFSATVAAKLGDGGAPLALTGTFRACRAPDIDAP